MKKAFTLAEVMITLTVIGIITAVIIPVAINSKPDENVMKFKKAHNTLYQTISTLVNSDKYYLNGDLGIKPNGNFIGDDSTYFCNTFSDVVTTRKINCSNYSLSDIRACSVMMLENYDGGGIVTNESIIHHKNEVDKCCRLMAQHVGEEIVTNDGVVFYQINPGETFSNYAGSRMRTSKDGATSLKSAYKGFCIDIDGINKGEDPFGYAIRIDGKIFTGARVDKWLSKSIQGE